MMPKFVLWLANKATGAWRGHSPIAWASSGEEYEDEASARAAAARMGPGRYPLGYMVLPIGLLPRILASVPADDPPRNYWLWSLGPPGVPPSAVGGTFPSAAAALAHAMRPEIKCGRFLVSDGPVPSGPEIPTYIKVELAA